MEVPQIANNTQHFSPLDGGVLSAYIAGTIGLGIWLGGKQKDARDYFVGSGEIPWWAILFSVVATETSALTFISIPGLAYLGDLTFTQVAMGYLLGRIVISYTLLPLYFDGEMVTAYALLEKRFGVATRRFASVTFMVTRAFGDSVRVFATAIPIALIIGPLISPQWVTPVSILALGGLTLVYTYHGGIRAVVWTDVLQTFVYLLGGIAALYLLGARQENGWNGILQAASEKEKLRLFDFSLGIDKPYTFLAGIIGGGFLSMASHGTDQLIVQRLLSARNLRDAQKALIGSGVFVIFQMLLFLMIGVGLYSYYGGAKFPTTDAIFSTFIVQRMPDGLKGLVLAAILAAAMSTVSGALNSLAAATLHDLYLPMRKNTQSPEHLLFVSKIFTLLWAAILIGGALLYRDSATPVVQVALSVASFTYGGLLGGFFLAIFLRRAGQRDAIIGMTAGIASMTLIVFADYLKLFDAFKFLQYVPKIAWPWYVLIGTTITFSVGALSSFAGGPSKKT